MRDYPIRHPHISHIIYALYIFPAAYLEEGDVVYSLTWGLTKRHAAKRIQRQVRKKTGVTIPIFKTVDAAERDRKARRAAERRAAESL